MCIEKELAEPSWCERLQRLAAGWRCPFLHLLANLKLFFYLALTFPAYNDIGGRVIQKEKAARRHKYMDSP